MLPKVCQMIQHCNKYNVLFWIHDKICEVHRLYVSSLEPAEWRHRRRCRTQSSGPVFRLSHRERHKTRKRYRPAPPYSVLDLRSSGLVTLSGNVKVSVYVYDVMFGVANGSTRWVTLTYTGRGPQHVIIVFTTGSTPSVTYKWFFLSVQKMDNLGGRYMNGWPLTIVYQSVYCVCHWQARADPTEQLL